MLTTRRLRRLDRDLHAHSGGSAGAAGADACLDRDGRRARGAYFTPPPLVDLVVGEALTARLGGAGARWREDGSPEITVLDPACGDGRFLAAAADRLADLAAARGFARGVDRAAARAAIVARCLVGVDRDPAFAELARARLGAGARVHCREALCDPPPDIAGGVDVVLGNPPYQRSIHFATTDAVLWEKLRGRYEATSFGEWDLYAAFLEQTLAWLRPGGEAGLVVPSRWMTAAFARRLRAKLASAGAVRALVDFGAAQIFDGATTYASVVFLSRAQRAGVVLSRARRAGVDVARRAGGAWATGRIAASSLSDAPWRLSVGRARGLLDRLATAAPALGDVARIVKGAGTNADRVFVLEDCRARGDLVTGVSRHLGDEVTVEAELARPCLRGRDVQPFGAVDPAVRCLVPYAADGALLAPAALPPRTAAYFARCRDRLEARERGRFRGDTYYCFGRPQNMAFFADPAPKVVVPDVARGGRAVLDASGAFALDSAYAVRLTGDGSGYTLEHLLAVLNSAIVALWLRETGVPLRGGYVRMKTAYLRGLPLPPHHALTGTGDDAVRRAYGIPEAVWPREQ